MTWLFTAPWLNNNLNQNIPSALSGSITHTKMFAGGDPDEVAFIIPEPSMILFVVIPAIAALSRKIVAEHSNNFSEIINTPNSPSVVILHE